MIISKMVIVFYRNEWVRFGICIPPDAKFDLYTWTPHWLPGLEHWTAVKSIEELENNTQDGKKYHFNNSTGYVAEPIS